MAAYKDKIVYAMCVPIDRCFFIFKQGNGLKKTKNTRKVILIGVVK